MGIPDQFYKGIWRLPKKLLQREVDLITDMGVEIIYNSRVGTDITMEQLREENDAVFIGAGCHKGIKLRCPGEDDFEGIVDCVTFLRKQAAAVNAEHVRLASSELF